MAVYDRIPVLLQASRPAVWVLPSSIYLCGVVCSGHFPSMGAAILLAIALSAPACLFLYGINDIYDYESDVLNPRKNAAWIDGIYLPKVEQDFVLSAVKLSAIAMLLLALPASIQSPQVMVYLSICILFSWAYSVPPFRFKERPIIDSVSNGVICWSVWACGYTVSGDKPFMQHASEIFGDGLFIFFTGCAFHAVLALADIEADTAAKQRTTATVYGVTFSTMFIVFCFLFSALSVDIRSDYGIASVAGVFVSLVLLIAPSLRSFIRRWVYSSLVLGVCMWDLRVGYAIMQGASVLH